MKVLTKTKMKTDMKSNSTKERDGFTPEEDEEEEPQ